MTDHAPTDQQRLAADPAVTAWVGANAGSGKTRVLTQRVARLLLAGAAPGKILCLTYTKAAAAEMQSRLFALLGDWSMQTDTRLRQMLAALSGDSAPINDETLRRARRLFARALETPGGLKIQTIHAFCDAVLRRFPLEAGVSPNFDVIDERQSALMLAEIRDAMARDAERRVDPAFDLIARRLNEDRFDQIIAQVISHRGALSAADAKQRVAALYGGLAARSSDEVAASHLCRIDADRLARTIAELQEGSKKDTDLSAALGHLAAGLAGAPSRGAGLLMAAMLVKSGARTGLPLKGLPTKGLGKRHPHLEAELDFLAGLAVAVRSDLARHELASRTRDLYRFAGALLARYQDAKDARSLLDFNDLISRSRDLLQDSDMRAWVLYKLDQGIDHVLVDEAQDTSPLQWEVIAAITDDFHTGQATRDPETELARSVFVVGDEKQSIYSFQGAEPAAFGQMRERLTGRVDGVGGRLERPDLITSFRSAPAILDVVDHVFAGAAAAGVTFSGDAVRHRAQRQGDAGRIDLWPLLEKAESPEQPDWWEPVDRPAPDDPKLRLAGMLADAIAAMIGTQRLPDRASGPGRLVQPGDVLVLVRSRDRLARGLIDHLKALGVPVAGSDRLSLAGELAVKDVMALIKAVLSPSDELSLAAALRSPLCSVSEDALFALAHGREGRLWAGMLAAGGAHARDAEMLRDMAARAGYLAPYEFLERLFVAHDGRRRLIARLGPEAEDCIDELMAQALAYEARETPSLTGFVTWIEAGDVTLKREMEKGADEVRVMTIHGAKGLEAPIVILPDTVSTGRRGAGTPVLLPLPDQDVTLWAGRAEADDEPAATARAAVAAKAEAEDKRLLYVGLTRAEDWLIFCGAGKRRDADKSWYGVLEQAMAGMGPTQTVKQPGAEDPILRFDSGASPPDAPGHAPSAAVPERPIEPDWLTPVAGEARALRLSPSALGGSGPTPASPEGPEPEEARLRGLAVHLLLERLPEVEARARAAAARALLEQSMPGLAPALADEAIAEAAEILDAPAFAELFAEDSLGEATISLPLPATGGRPMLGRIDRLLVTPRRVLIVDFKTDWHVPDRVADVPAPYLAQMGAYLYACKGVFTDRQVEAGLLWTRARTLMLLPDTVLQNRFASALQQQTGIDLTRGDT